MAPALLSCLRISNASTLLTARSITLWPCRLPYCSGARAFVFSATCIIALPTCLKATLQSTGNRTMVLSPDRSVTPDFFISITSRQCFHLCGAKPSFNVSCVIVQSRAAMRSSVAPAFIVEKDKADE